MMIKPFIDECLLRGCRVSDIKSHKAGGRNPTDNAVKFNV